MLDAVWLALGGIAIVFVVLAILLFAMIVIKRVFPPKSDSGKEGA